MKFGVLGTGMVGQTLAGKLVSLGHEVTMGSREINNEKAVEWADKAGDQAHQGNFADAAAFGEVVINATAGAASLDALEAAGADNLSGKVLIDVANPLDFSKGMPPTMTVCNTESLGEQIQEAYPEARVVKTLNTINAGLMVAPRSIEESHSVFVCGNDDEAKAQVRDLLVSFGWPTEDVLDLGDITGARGVEMYLPLWLRLAGATSSWMVNVKVVTPKGG